MHQIIAALAVLVLAIPGAIYSNYSEASWRTEVAALGNVT